MMPYCLVVFAECVGSPVCSFCIHIREGAGVNLSLLSAGGDVFLGVHSQQGWWRNG